MMAGISVVDDCAPPGPLCCQMHAPSVSAIDIWSVLVSKARNREAKRVVMGAVDSVVLGYLTMKSRHSVG